MVKANTYITKKQGDIPGIIYKVYYCLNIYIRDSLGDRFGLVYKVETFILGIDPLQVTFDLFLQELISIPLFSPHINVLYKYRT